MCSIMRIFMKSESNNFCKSTCHQKSIYFFLLLYGFFFINEVVGVDLPGFPIGEGVIVIIVSLPHFKLFYNMIKHFKPFKRKRKLYFMHASLSITISMNMTMKSFYYDTCIVEI